MNIQCGVCSKDVAGVNDGKDQGGSGGWWDGGRHGLYMHDEDMGELTVEGFLREMDG